MSKRGSFLLRHLWFPFSDSKHVSGRDEQLMVIEYGFKHMDTEVNHHGLVPCYCFDSGYQNEISIRCDECKKLNLYVFTNIWIKSAFKIEWLSVAYFQSMVYYLCHVKTDDVTPQLWHDVTPQLRLSAKENEDGWMVELT